MNKLKKRCAFCNSVFYKGKFTSKRKWEITKYCSRPCYWKDKVDWYTCQWCKKKFRRKSHTPEKQKFCSKKCAGKAWSESHTYPRKPCKVCGKPVKYVASKFCCRACFLEWYRGENVYNYLGKEGPWRSDMGFYTSAFWYEQCGKVRRRDKVCQRCGKTQKENGKALDVHHVIPRRISQDDSVSNLIALCVSCHPIVEAEARELYG